MAEKYRKIVNAPHRGMKSVRDAISGTRPTGTVGKTARISGIGVAGLAQFLMWLPKYVFLDNHAQRKIEDMLRNMRVGRSKKTGQDKKMSKFAKNNPTLSSLLIWWASLGMIGGGAYGYNELTGRASSDNYNDDKIEYVEVPIYEDEPFVLAEPDAQSDQTDNRGGHIVVTHRENSAIDPRANDFIDRCIALENITCIPIIYTETYRATPKVQPKETVWTHGYGMTWSPDKNGNMTVRDYEKTKKDKSGKIIQRAHKPKVKRTKDSDINESQAFLRGHIYPQIKRYATRPLTLGEFYGLCTACYQYEGHVDDICMKLNQAKTPQEVADAFMASSATFGGTVKRRWVCGMLAAGFITVDDVLNGYCDAFYELDPSVFYRVSHGKKHFNCDTNTIKLVLGRKSNGHNVRVRDEVTRTADGRAALAELKGKSVKRTVAQNDDDESRAVSRSMELMLAANKELHDHKFDAAAKLYEDAISANPNNMEAYSSLALTYKRMGDDLQSVEYYEKCCTTVQRANARMNANKDLLYDADVKANSYFNAGSAREAMAKIYSARGDVDNAAKYYRMAQKNYETARENCMAGDGDAGKLAVYERAIERVQKTVSGLAKKKSKPEQSKKSTPKKSSPTKVDKKKQNFGRATVRLKQRGTKISVAKFLGGGNNVRS